MENQTREQALLAQLRDKHCGGVNAELARKLGMDQTYVNRLFYPAGKRGGKGIGLEVMRRASEVFRLPVGFWDGAALQGDLLSEEAVKSAVPKPAPSQTDGLVPDVVRELVAHAVFVMDTMDEEARTLALQAFATLAQDTNNRTPAELMLAAAMAMHGKSTPPPPSKAKRSAKAPKAAKERTANRPKLEVKPGGGQRSLIDRIGVKPLKEVLLDDYAGELEQKMYKRFANYPKANDQEK
jgi:hypothetical protein